MRTRRIILQTLLLVIPSDSRHHRSSQLLPFTRHLCSPSSKYHHAASDMASGQASMVGQIEARSRRRWEMYDWKSSGIYDSRWLTSYDCHDSITNMFIFIVSKGRGLRTVQLSKRTRGGNSSHSQHAIQRPTGLLLPMNTSQHGG